MNKWWSALRAWLTMFGGLVLAFGSFESCVGVYMSWLPPTDAERIVTSFGAAVSMLLFFTGLGVAVWGAIQLRTEWPRRSN